MSARVPSLEASVESLLSRGTGHFRLESGHHGELWLELERLCLRTEPVKRLAAELARRLAPHRVEAICGPLVEGAFVGLFVADALGLPFTYSERRADASDAPSDSLFPARYALPRVLRAELAGKRVAVVNDVVNAGSAVRATLADLVTLGANPVAIGTLAVLGKKAAELSSRANVALETLAEFSNELWEPDACPLCARGVPLTQP